MVLRSLAVFEQFGEAVGGSSGFVRSGVLIGVSLAMRPTLERTLALQRAVGIRAEIVEPADLSRIDSPSYPEARIPFLYELAERQWTLEEIRTGLAWRFFQAHRHEVSL